MEPGLFLTDLDRKVVGLSQEINSAFHLAGEIVL